MKSIQHIRHTLSSLYTNKSTSKQNTQASQQAWLLCYRLLREVIFLALLGFFGLMLLEGIMPGFVSTHINFAKYIFSVGLLIIGHQTIEKRFHIQENAPYYYKIFFWIALVVAGLLLLNSLLKFPFYAISIIFILTSAIAYMLKQEFFA